MKKKGSNPDPPAEQNGPGEEQESALVMPENTAGIVTLSNWTLMPDGRTYMYVWAKNWTVTTDKMFPVEELRTSERWQLLAMVDGSAKVVIPGCGVKAWAQCDMPPTGTAHYVVSSGLGTTKVQAK